MKKYWKTLIVVLVFFGIILMYSWFRTLIDKTNLLISFDKTFSMVIQEIWKVISFPVIFISIIILVVVWNFRDQIFHFVKKVREIKYKDFSAAFELGDEKNFESIQKSQTPPVLIGTQVTQSNDDKLFRSLISVMGEETIAVLLELDDKILSMEGIFNILKQNKLFHSTVISDEKPELSLFYYWGIFKSLNSYFLRNLSIAEVSEDKNQIKFSLKPRVREMLEEMMKKKKELKKK